MFCVCVIESLILEQIQRTRASSLEEEEEIKRFLTVLSVWQFNDIVNIWKNSYRHGMQNADNIRISIAVLIAFLLLIFLLLFLAKSILKSRTNWIKLKHLVFSGPESILFNRNNNILIIDFLIFFFSAVTFTHRPDHFSSNQSKIIRSTIRIFCIKFRVKN